MLCCSGAEWIAASCSDCIWAFLNIAAVCGLPIHPFGQVIECGLTGDFESAGVWKIEGELVQPLLYVRVSDTFKSFFCAGIGDVKRQL